VLSLLTIKNIALIDDLTIEFGRGLNLLTGETGSGKSIIVDSLAALTGARVTSELIKEGASSAVIEGVFAVDHRRIGNIVIENDIEIDPDGRELTIRRELSTSGKNRVFINDQLATQGLLRRVGEFLVDIHGQGEHTSLYDTSRHIGLLDEFAGVTEVKRKVAEAFTQWSIVKAQLASVERDQSESLRLLDVLRFEIGEIKAANPVAGEDTELEEEKRRLNNVEKLTASAGEAFSLLYDNADSTAATLEKAERRVKELADYESRFNEYSESISTARAVIDDLAITLRDYLAHLEFSPERLEKIEDRLAEISRLKRKYGESIELVLEHLHRSEERLAAIESAEFSEEDLRKKLAAATAEYISSAGKLYDKRKAAAAEFAKQVEADLKAVALEKARFEVRIDTYEPASGDEQFTSDGFDRVEFYFSANPGESPKPLARIASGGEASRLMLILKTTARVTEAVTAVFDEIDAGIGGRVAEAVGRKLKDLSATQQVLCVTHQPQIASLADGHYIVEKQITKNRTVVSARELAPTERVEEIARMLAGEQITEAARENARTMLASGR
jgi:DNA repair protein RecN (Recombination protein N)